MSGVVTFNQTDFLALYPEFSDVSLSVLQSNFNIAQLFCNNTIYSVVSDTSIRATLLYALTAHITFMFSSCTANGNSPQGIVGRINSATEGTVTCSAEYLAGQSAQWYIQTRYGALFWQATLPFRSQRYIPPPIVGPSAGYAFGPENGYFNLWG